MPEDLPTKIIDRPAFLTGSQVYGTPHEDSDWDMVVLMTHEAIQALVPLADKVTDREKAPSDADGELNAGSFRFGRLNIIAVTDPVMYDVWKAGTLFLMNKAPVTREQACNYLKKKRDEAKEKK